RMVKPLCEPVAQRAFERVVIEDGGKDEAAERGVPGGNFLRLGANARPDRVYGIDRGVAGRSCLLLHHVILASNGFHRVYMAMRGRETRKTPPSPPCPPGVSSPCTRSTHVQPIMPRGAKFGSDPVTLS